MFSFYMDRPWWVRTLIALLVLTLGVVMSIEGINNGSQTRHEIHNGVDVEVRIENRSAQGAFRGGVMLVGIGCMLMLVCGQTRSEKNGYRF